MSLYESIKNNVNEFDNTLEPRYDARKSFYGKARVNNDDNGYTLVSYTTPILTVKDGKIKLLCDESALSQTTMRHVREFLQQMAEDGHIEIPDKITRQWLLSQGNINESEGKGNVIPRNWKVIRGELLRDCSAGKAGTEFEVFKDKYGEAVMKFPTGDETYLVNWSMMRAPEMVKITKVETGDKNIKESENIDMKLLTLLKKKDALLYDDTIDDDIAYEMMERIDNVIINNYSDEEIDAVKKYLRDNGLLHKDLVESDDRQDKIISFSKHLKDMANEMESVAEMYDENMLDDEDDVFGGTEDSYAMEMLDQHISDIFLNDPVFSKLDDATLTNVISDIINNIVEGKGITFESLLMTLKKYDALKQWSISIGEGETFTFPKEIVDKVNAEYDAAKPEIIKDIKREFNQFAKQLKPYMSNEEINNLPETKAYKDAIADPDDIWCECNADNGEEYKPDGESYLGVDKHGYICNNCKKYVQIG